MQSDFGGYTSNSGWQLFAPVRGGSLDITGSAEIDGDLTVEGTLHAGTFAPTSSILGDVTCSSLLDTGTLSVQGSTSLDNGEITTDGAGELTAMTATFTRTGGATGLTVVGHSSFDNGTILTDGTGNITAHGGGTFGNSSAPSTTTIVGNLTVDGTTSMGTINSGTNPATFGSLTASSITSTGTISSGTNSASFGPLTASSIICAGTITSGTHSATFGALSASSLLAGAATITGTFSCTSSMTLGNVTISTMTAGASNINPCTIGTLSCDTYISPVASSTMNIGTDSNTVTTVIAPATTLVLGNAVSPDIEITSTTNGLIEIGTNGVSSTLKVGSAETTTQILGSTLNIGTAGTGAITIGNTTGPNSLSIATNFSAGTHSATVGALSCAALTASSILDNGTFSCGTFAATTGLLTCAGLTAGTHAATVGALTSNTINCTGLTATSILDNGTFSCGTNAATTGLLLCAGVTSSQPITTSAGLQGISLLTTNATGQWQMQPALSGNAFEVSITGNPAQNTTITLPDPGTANTSFILANASSAQSISGGLTLNAGAFTYNHNTAARTLLSGASGGLAGWVAPTRTFYTNAAGTALTANSNRMVGLDFLFTPTFSGNVAVWSDGYAANTSGAGVDITLFWNVGSSTPPAPNATATGTSVGVGVTQRVQSGLNNALGKSVAIFTGLAINNTYWFDIQCNSDNLGGSVAIHNVNAIIEEFI